MNAKGSDQVDRTSDQDHGGGSDLGITAWDWALGFSGAEAGRNDHSNEKEEK